MATKTTSSKLFTTIKNARNWNTPQRYKAFQYAIWSLSGILLISVISAVGAQRATTQQVGRDSADSVLFAERLKNTVAGMDAFTANELLTETNSPEAKAALEGYQGRYKDYVERFVKLAENITYDEAERAPIKNIQENMGEYIRLLQKARDFKALGKPAEMLVPYREAIDLLDSKIIPKIDQLSKVNSDQMQLQIKGDRSGAALFGVIIVGGLLIAWLVALQLFLLQKTRRQFNLPLLGATAIAAIFLFHSAMSLGRAASSLAVARDDAFPSLKSMREARALSYRANADESRYLLDTEKKQVHENAFNKKKKEIMSLPRDLILEDIARKISSNSKADLKRVTGLVAGAVNNITFPGEGPALIEALRAWEDYLNVDQEIREKERSGDRKGAISICLGKSDQAYEKFKKALEKVQVINEEAMKNNLDQSDRTLAYFEVQAAIALILVAILTQYGLRPRIKEYQV
jgi:tetratricopeptide (TPR) repeat protein